jgi:hypothetical protein
LFIAELELRHAARFAERAAHCVLAHAGLDIGKVFLG